MIRSVYPPSNTVYSWDGKGLDGKALGSGIYLLKADNMVIEKITISR